MVPKVIHEKDVIRVGKEPMVLLALKEYKKLSEQVVPTYYLKGKEAEELDELVKEGLKDYKAGRTKRIKSLTDLD